jgi:hypothetical protein
MSWAAWILKFSRAVLACHHLIYLPHCGSFVPWATVVSSRFCVVCGKVVDISHTAKQYLSCALVRGRGVVFRPCYRGMAKSAGENFPDGAIVTFQ